MTTPNLSIFTGSKGLGRVWNLQSQINVKFWDVNIPLTSSAGRLSFNAMGKTRILMIQCSHDGAGFDGVDANAKVGDFIYEMEAWVNAPIQTSKVFTDFYGTSYTVDAVDFTWTVNNQNPNRVLYTLIMKEK